MALAPLESFAQSVIPAITPGTRSQEVDLIAALIYDSNVTGSDGTLPTNKPLKKGDEIFEPEITFDLIRPLGRETVYLQGSAGYDVYIRNPILNRETLDIRPGVIGQLGYCQVGLGGDYTRAQSDLSQLALDPSGGRVVIQVQNTLQVEQIAANANCGRSFGLAPNATVSETWTQNSSPIQSFTNARTFSGSAGLAYRRPTFGSLSLFGSYSHTDYPDRSGLIALLIPGVASTFETVSGGVTYTRAIGSRLQADGSISYTHLSSPGAASGSFSGITYSGSFNYQASTRLRATASVSRATTPSNRLNSTFAIEDLYSGNVSYQLGQRISVSGGGTFAHNSYNGVPYPMGLDLTDEKIYTVFGDVEYKFARHLSLGGNVQHLQRDANFPGLSYPETRAGLTVRATF